MSAFLPAGRCTVCKRRRGLPHSTGNGRGKKNPGSVSDEKHDSQSGFTHAHTHTHTHTHHKIPDCPSPHTQTYACMCVGNVSPLSTHHHTHGNIHTFISTHALQFSFLVENYSNNASA